jgi:hypothetical protein
VVVAMASSFPFVALHHPGGAVTTESSFVQRVIDSEGGVFFASLSHTFGALLFTAGIALYLYQARLVRVAKEELAMPSVKWLPLAHILTVIGVGANGIGGLMRLKQGDHPGLEELGTSLWVQVLLVKHIFLVVGVGLAMLLTAQTFWMARKPEAPGNFLPHANRMTAYAVTSFLTIIAATVGGVIAQGALVPMAPEPQGNMEDMGAGSILFAAGEHYENATLYISGSPLAPGRAETPVTIPTGVTKVWIEIAWTSNMAVIDAQLLNESNEEVAAQKTLGAQRIEFFVEHDAIPSGNWKVVVTSSQAFPSERLTVTAKKTVGTLVGAENTAEKTFKVPVGGANGAPGAEFVEINLKMEIGKSFRWEWYVVGAETNLYFDIHTHENGATEYPVQQTAARGSGTYVHEKTEYASLLWRNDGLTEVTVHYKIVGDFVVDSEVGT